MGSIARLKSRFDRPIDGVDAEPGLMTGAAPLQIKT
jgi:hypothetical protein